MRASKPPFLRNAVPTKMSRYCGYFRCPCAAAPRSASDALRSWEHFFDGHRTGRDTKDLIGVDRGLRKQSIVEGFSFGPCGSSCTTANSSFIIRDGVSVKQKVLVTCAEARAIFRTYSDATSGSMMSSSRMIVGLGGGIVLRCPLWGTTMRFGACACGGLAGF